MFELPLYSLFQLLADGNFHRRAELMAQLKLSLGDFRQLLAQAALNSELQNVRGHGYRIPGGIELLDTRQILTVAGSELAKRIELEVLPTIDSTNRYLLDKPYPSRDGACFAEYQTAGRGRRGRQWVSPFASNLYCSLLWYFPPALALSGLSLVVGIALVNALNSYGVAQLQLKWPNDLVYRGAKVGGILIEVQRPEKNASRAVIGIGLNLNMPRPLAGAITQAWTDIRTITQQSPRRNQIAGLLLREIFLALSAFANYGFPTFYPRWQQLDALYGQEVTVYQSKDEKISGLSLGVDNVGNLLVEQAGQVRSFNTGEVSVRLNTQPREQLLASQEVVSPSSSANPNKS